MRIGDLLSLRWLDVQDKQEVTLTEQKTGKQRKITINPKVADAINLVVSVQKSIGKFEPDGYLFANRWGGQLTISYINKRLKVIFKKYNVHVQNPSSHTLRKTFGKAIWENDNKSERALTYLSMIFSHSSIAITRKYIGITEQKIADMYLSL